MGAGIRCQNRCQKECQNIYQKISQIERQNICIYATFTSRWYAINYVRILPGGDQSKKETSVFRLSKFWNRQESNIAGMNMRNEAIGCFDFESDPCGSNRASVKRQVICISQYVLIVSTARSPDVFLRKGVSSATQVTKNTWIFVLGVCTCF